MNVFSICAEFTMGMESTGIIFKSGPVADTLSSTTMAGRATSLPTGIVSGSWDMGDVVRCSGRTGRLPRVGLTGRTGVVAVVGLSLAGAVWA
ncbi:hypothetical protein [uncultured Duncaniella sp.]|uniref:hypothetical protein n=1 Tax=uncultured Duncaniella sp. TaxID=2768039 RepID=UPI0025A9A544|nr:hypothetical protein [uncultured Duncaniella sp.]